MSSTYLEVLQDINTKIDALSRSQELLEEAIHLNEFAKADLTRLLDNTASRITNDGLSSPSLDEHMFELISIARNK